jgi:hypothetical protein
MVTVEDHDSPAANVSRKVAVPWQRCSRGVDYGTSEVVLTPLGHRDPAAVDTPKNPSLLA